MPAPTSTLCSPAAPRTRAFDPPPSGSPESHLWVGLHKSHSGYRNVYYSPGEQLPWLGRVAKRVGVPGRFPTPRAAAAATAAFLAAFYAQYQVDWRRTLRRRKNLGRITKTAAGYYLVHVFVMGSPELVSSDFGNANLPSHVKAAGLPVGKPPSLGVWKWPTFAAACAARREWIRRFRDSLGGQRRFAGLYLWRA